MENPLQNLLRSPWPQSYVLAQPVRSCFQVACHQASMRLLRQWHLMPSPWSPTLVMLPRKVPLLLVLPQAGSCWAVRAHNNPMTSAVLSLHQTQSTRPMRSVTLLSTSHQATLGAWSLRGSRKPSVLEKMCHTTAQRMGSGFPLSWWVTTSLRACWRATTSTSSAEHWLLGLPWGLWFMTFLGQVRSARRQRHPLRVFLRAQVRQKWPTIFFFILFQNPESLHPVMVLMKRCLPSPSRILWSQRLTSGSRMTRLQLLRLRLLGCPRIKVGMDAGHHGPPGHFRRHVGAIVTMHLLRVLGRAGGARDAAAAQCVGTEVSNKDTGATCDWKCLVTSPGWSFVRDAEISAWLFYGGAIPTMIMVAFGQIATSESTMFEWCWENTLCIWKTNPI